MAEDEARASDSSDRTPWYSGISSYQWLVLAIACAGWVFDVYEGQIFNITRDQMLADILASEGNKGDVRQYGDLFLGIFLLGGTVGGLGFGSLADRYGRRPTMIVTILTYSLFSGLTYFADTLWQIAALRFLVAIGVGGEWAVAASLVAEVFPARARAHASGIFHASSTLGTWLAAIVGIAVGSQWRYAYLVGVLPALLVLWVRASVREPERWQAKKAQTGTAGMGRFRDLWQSPTWRRRAILGTLLASIGLGTFWAVTVAGQNLVDTMLVRWGVEQAEAASRAKFAYGIVQAAGGGLGLLAFGPICARIGRRRAFVAFQLLAVAIVPLTCFGPQNYTQLLIALPVFGFLTLGIHAGYAIYFPELFPTNIRATGTSLCFNGGRLLAVPILVFSGWLKGLPGVDIRWALTGLSLLFLLGIGIALAMPETRSKPLPE
ncbi:MAG: MFS transporter [Planctomycetaceae bacterium]|nr:MFS transporter [Planctomycetaceae bacterium]